LAGGADGLIAGKYSADNAIQNNFIQTAIPILLAGYLTYDWMRTNVETEDSIVQDSLGETVITFGVGGASKALTHGAKKAAGEASKLVQGTANLVEQEAAAASKFVANEAGAVGPSVEEFGGSVGKTLDSAGHLGVREGSQLKYFADLTKHSGKSAEELANGLRGAQGKIGEALEEHLARAFGGQSSFKAGGRDFDGAVNNLWYEAKSGRYWVDNFGNKGFAKFKSDMGARLRIASENGKEYQLISNTPICSEAKRWLTEKGIKFLEILE
jgi:molybdopterin converting factor small subunit